MPEEQSGSVLLNYFFDFFIEDWFASVPITICAVVMLGVIIERSLYYSRNNRELPPFVRGIQAELEKDNLDGAIALARQVGGLLGQMTEEGLRLIKHHSKNFSGAFDISANLYIRDLEKHLWALGTIGATAPFWGLFGTVVGVIVTLKLLGEQGGQSSAVVIGVAKALIATGYGLIVAIISVTLSNMFSNNIGRFEQDFQVIKLTLLDYIQQHPGVVGGAQPVMRTQDARERNYQPPPQQQQYANTSAAYQPPHSAQPPQPGSSSPYGSGHGYYQANIPESRE